MKWFKQHILHDILGWGFCYGIEQKDPSGFQHSYVCRYCDYAITQDSTGSWFHLSRKVKRS